MFAWLQKLISLKEVPQATRKALTSETTGFGSGSLGTYIDSFNKRRDPTWSDLGRELKNTAWTCAKGNAATCAAFNPRLFVQLGPQLAQPIKSYRPVRKDEHWMRKTNEMNQEIMDHPFLRLLRNANPLINQQELLELTTLYQEVYGIAYWYIPRDFLGRPYEVWPFSPVELQPCQTYGTLDPANLAAFYQPKYYDLLTQGGTYRIDPQFIIEFRYPHPRDPFRSGLSPMRASFESILLNSEHIARRLAFEENRARPDSLLVPGEVIGEDERQRLEGEFSQKFSRGGTGKVLIAESEMKLYPISFPENTNLLAEHGVTKEDICNAFDYPLSYVTKETNLANLQGSRELYMGHGIRPRLNRRDQKITEKLLPLYDPAGRLYCMAEDPVPEDVAAKREQEKVDLEHGTQTINEVRAERGLPPVKWGELPWLPTYFAPADPDNPNRNVYDRTGYGGYKSPAGGGRNSDNGDDPESQR